MGVPTWGAQMARNPLTTMEYLDGLAACANIGFWFDQGKGTECQGLSTST